MRLGKLSLSIGSVWVGSVLALVLYVGPAMAQDSGDATWETQAGQIQSVYQVHNDDIELAREYIQTQRQAIVASNLGLTNTESQAFWPVFREYREARRPISDRKLAVITDYADNYEFMTGQTAQRLLNEWIDIETDELALQKEYIPRFNAVEPVAEPTHDIPSEIRAVS